MRVFINYWDNLYLGHFERDLDELHDFSDIVHVIPESYAEDRQEALTALFQASTRAGLRPWADPLRVVGAFGLGPHGSRLLERHPDARRVRSDGSMANVACYSHPETIQTLIRWHSFIATSGAYGILYDEFDLDRCYCGRCTPYATERTLRWMTALAKASGLQTQVCLHCVPFSKRQEEKLLMVASLPDVDEIGLSFVPTEYSSLEDYGEFTSYHLNWLQRARSLRPVVAWAQAYSIPAGKENMIEVAANLCYEHGAQALAFWGFKGNEQADCRNGSPTAAWDVVRSLAKEACLVR